MPGSEATDRAVTPVVEKALTIGLVVLFVGGTTSALFGAAVPTYRDAVGGEVGERVLATATERVEESIPPDGTAVRSTTRVDLPATIRGASYDVVVDGRDLVLDHPDESVGGRSRPAVPDSVVAVDGEWQSGADLVVTVRSTSGGLAVQLGERDA